MRLSLDQPCVQPLTRHYAAVKFPSVCASDCGLPRAHEYAAGVPQHTPFCCSITAQHACTCQNSARIWQLYVHGKRLYLTGQWSAVTTVYQ